MGSFGFAAKPHGVVDSRPRGGVVTHRTANPFTPVRFRAWPPTSHATFLAMREPGCMRKHGGRARLLARYDPRVGHRSRTNQKCWIGSAGRAHKDNRKSICFTWFFRIVTPDWCYSQVVQFSVNIFTICSPPLVESQEAKSPIIHEVWRQVFDCRLPGSSRRVFDCRAA